MIRLCVAVGEKGNMGQIVFQHGFLPSGGSVLCCHGENQEKEALWMAEQIKILKEKGVPYKDITILYRAHYLTRSIEQVFLKEEIPYTIYSRARSRLRAVWESDSFSCGEDSC